MMASRTTMASKQVTLVIVVAVTVATILAAPALAADLLVGDSQGWRLDVDYDNWVDDNDFIVGDTLVFKYDKGRHSVVQATAASFAACSQANDSRLGVWTSGDDRVALNTSGHWWFFCGVGNHCQQGMKFNVTVLPAVSLSLPPSSSTPTPGGGDTTTGLACARRGGFAVVLACMAAVAGLLF